jgi:hypothetical protein
MLDFGMEIAIPAGPRGVAQDIRKISLKYPELSDSEIARKVGCSPQNVSQVLKTFLGNKSREELTDYQENQAEVFDSLALRLLESVTQEKLDKTKPMEAITGAAILIDKARLVRGQATGINVTVLMDVVEAIRSRQSAPHPQTISGTSAGE